MNKENFENLIINSASVVHADWCEAELKAFFERAANAYRAGATPYEAMQQACMKGDVRRNEIVLDGPGLQSFNPDKIFGDFEMFKYLVDNYIVVKRFINREVTEEEKVKLGEHYKDGKENILRSFASLSKSSQKENLEAALGATNVFVELSQAGK